MNCQDTFPQPFFFFLFFFLALIALTVEAHVTNTPHCRFNTVVELKEEGEKRRNHKNMGSFSKMPFANNGAPRSSTDLERRDGGGGGHGYASPYNKPKYAMTVEKSEPSTRKRIPIAVSPSIPFPSSCRRGLLECMMADVE